MSATPATDPFIGASSEPIPPAKSRGWVKWVAISAGLVLLLGVAAWVWFQQRSRQAPVQASSFPELKVPLDKLDVTGPAASVTSLKVNGSLQVANSLALVPTTQPSNPVAGQIYYDKATNRPLIYNGTQFVVLQGGGNTQVTNNTNNNNTFVTNNAADIINNAGDTINNVTNVIGGGGNVTANGTAGSIAMFTGATTLSSSLLNQSGQGVSISDNTNAANTVNIDAGTGAAAIQIGNSATTHDIQIGTGAGAQIVAVGSGSTGSATTIQGGTGGLALMTGNATGVTGDISITSGNSSTTASGNITIDAGSGVLDGTVVSTKTFEADTEDMTNWFSATVTQSAVMARIGTNSLEINPSGAFWGVIEDNNSSNNPVTAGHLYYYEYYVRAAGNTDTINTTISYLGSATTNSLNQVTDATTGWTLVSGTATAPAGATRAFFRFSTNDGVAGQKHYVDDFQVIDLSSSSAFSSIDIGTTNAKAVTIGNANQINPTTIRGSGIALQAGQGNLTLTGGAVTLTGSASSILSTSAGSLTITSATTATWGVATSTTGTGGDLTIRGGGGAFGNNNGGDLILRGGAKSGTGTEGSVLVKPSNDSTDAFQIQSSVGTPLLNADTTTMQISVTGTTSAFAKLTLTNAHFATTQTNPPTIGTPTNCGATPTATVTAGSTDSAGSFTITSGTGSTSSTCDTVFTFNQPYTAAPKSIIVVGKTDTASALRQIYVVSANATTFTTSFATSAAGADSTPYSFSYWVVE